MRGALALRANLPVPGGRGRAVFGVEIVCYLFLGGTGAGDCFVLTVLGLLVPRNCLSVQQVDGMGDCGRTALSVPRAYRVLFAPAFACALLALVLGMVFLLVDLGRVDRILLLITQPNPSHIVVGAYALAACVVLAGVLALVWGGVVRRVGPRALTALQALTLACAAVVMAYTGLLLQSLRAVALWHSAWLPVLFVLSSLSCGFALVVGVAQFSGAGGAFASVLSRATVADAGVIVAEALVAAALLATVAHAAQAAQEGGVNGTMAAAAESVRQLVCGAQAPLFWGGFVALGLAVPLCIEVVCVMLRRLPSGAVLGLAASILAGGLALRWCVVEAGMHPVLSVLGLE